MKRLIQGGRIIDPANGIDRVADLAIAEGRIVGLDVYDFHPDELIEAAGLTVIPGLIDLAAQLREPGQEHKATILSECRAAVAAGITTVCAMPNTVPPIDSPADVRLVRQKAQEARGARVSVIGALTQGLDGKHLTEMDSLREAGCIAVTNALHPLSSPLILRRALEYAASLGLIVVMQPLDHALMADGCAHEGPVASRMGLPGIPVAAETAALGQILALVEQTGARVHFGRLSSAAGLRTLQRAIEDGLPVSGDVAAHHLFLTEMDIVDFNSLCHVLPPLRDSRDLQALRSGIAYGTLTAICSDHQPHENDAKLMPFPATAPGISGLDTLLPLTLRLVDEGVLDLSEAIRRVTCAPANLLGLEVGDLGANNPADLCIFDADEEWTLDAEDLHSKGRNTPFQGWAMRGRVQQTLVEGKTVYQSAKKANS